MRGIKPGVYPVGNFKIISGKVVVSDPCYDRGTWCQGILDNVKNGDWIAFATIIDERSWGNRVSEFLVNHMYHQNTGVWEKTSFEVGVDSGQAGVFDDAHYRDDDLGLSMNKTETRRDDKIICDDEPWYSWCCDRTLSDPGAGVILFGAVSQSGFGDGGYNCYIHKNQDGVIDGIKIIFIRAEEEDEYSEAE